MSHDTTRRRSRVPLIATVLVVILVAVLVGGEFYARNRVENCLTTQFESELGSKIDVDLGLQPVLFSLATNKFSSVEISSDDTKFGPAQDMQVQATVDDVDLSGSDTSSGQIGSSNADVTWSTDGILATLQEQGVGGIVSGATSDPAAGTLNFAIVGGLAELTVRPVVQGDSIVVETVDASILGIGIPTDLADSVVGILTDSLQAYPLGMTPDSIEVTDTGIDMTLSGGQYDIPVQQDSEQRISC
ncbi:MAG: DUF2993 domain-containing protein [Rhodococcus sp. (in: high G+C Gram-positive bacteria)]